MRGKVVTSTTMICWIRITPAHAGKSLSDPRPSRSCRDHPRACGEKQKIAACYCFLQGSPPRMRGKVVGQEVEHRAGGITPAHAGKSLFACILRCICRDHPRACGEKFDMLPLEIRQKGSPPRMRGKDSVCNESAPLVGITPAHAGKRLKRSRSTMPHAAIVPLFRSVCNKPAGSDGSPAGHDAPPFLPIENAAPASPAYNLRSL